MAAATQSLCDAANELIQGHASEEKLISSAKLVASNTARLLVACRVKADPNSTAMHRLQVSGVTKVMERICDALWDELIPWWVNTYLRFDIILYLMQQVAESHAKWS